MYSFAPEDGIHRTRARRRFVQRIRPSWTPMSEMVLRTVERSGVDNNPRIEKESEVSRFQLQPASPAGYTTEKDRFAKPNWKPVMAVVTEASGFSAAPSVTNSGVKCSTVGWA